MFISRECDYAFRILRDLADYEVKSVKSICDREKVPRPYAYKILKKLEKSGFVTSYRGPNGGYILNSGKDRSTIFDVVLAIEEDIFLNECMKEGYQCNRYCNRNECRFHCEIGRIQGRIAAVLKERTLGEILGD